MVDHPSPFLEPNQNPEIFTAYRKMSSNIFNTFTEDDLAEVPIFLKKHIQ